MRSTKLKNIVDLILNSGQASKTLPYLALENLASSAGKLDTVVELSAAGGGSPGLARVQRGDVLFGKLRPYLAKSFLVDQDAYASTELLALRAKAGVEDRWLHYLVMSQPFIDWAVATSYGSKMPRTSWYSVREFELRVPDSAAQMAVADYLDAETARIDALVAKKRRLLAVMEERREDLVSRLLWLQDEFRYTSRKLKHLTKLPTSGNRDHSSFTFSDDGVPCLRGLNVRPGLIQTKDLLRISQDDHKRHAPTALQPGDLVIVRSGLAGAAAIIPREFGECNCVDLVVVRRSKLLIPRYLEYVVNSREAQDQVLAEQSGALLKHFNAIDAGSLRIPYRPLKDQKAIVNRLDDEDGRLLKVEQRMSHQLGLLNEHRQALITAAVTGQLDIPGSAA